MKFLCSGSVTARWMDGPFTVEAESPEKAQAIATRFIRENAPVLESLVQVDPAE